MPISIADLKAAGLTAEQTLQVWEMLEAERAEERMVTEAYAERRRELWRNQKEAQRKRVSAGSPPDVRAEVNRTPLSKKERREEAPLPFGDRVVLHCDIGQSKNDWPSDYKQQFWNRYPRKEGKAAALRTLQAIRAKGELEWPTLIAGVERYASDPNREQAYTKHPTTWLNGGCWDDEPLPARANGGQHGKGHETNDEWIKRMDAKFMG